MLGAVDLVQPATAPQLLESGPITMDSRDDPKLVVAAIGSYSCADVWVSRPAANRQHYELRLYARVGTARVLIAQVDPDTLAYTAEGAQEGTIAISIRGRPASAFELECAPTDDDITDIQFFMQAWHADVESNATVGPDPMVSVRQGQAGAASLRWPVYLSDGTSAQGIVNKPVFVRLSDGTAAAGTTSSPVTTQPVRPPRLTYSLAAPALATLTVSANTNLILASLWNGTAGKRVELQRIEVSYYGGATSGTVRIRAKRITSQPTGSTTTPEKHDTSDANATTVCRIASAAVAPGADLLMFAPKPNGEGLITWVPDQAAKPIVLLNGEGLELRATADTGTGGTMTFGFNLQWIEI